ncbi:MAG: sulfatase-like hydrolase/transferase [Myxococcales bacterium]|nr:sulfatase-like hydrolase/transferase [Myxococcales bacterium]
MADNSSDLIPTADAESLPAPSAATPDAGAKVASAKPGSGVLARVRRAVAWLLERLANEPIALGTFAALMTLGASYWVRLIYAIHASPTPLFGLRPGGALAMRLLANITQDLALAVCMTALVYACARGVRRLPKRVLRIAVGAVLVVALNLVLASSAMITLGHYGVLFSMNSGLTYEVLVETLQPGMGNTFSLIGFSDWVFLLAPAIFLWLFWLLPRSTARVRGIAMMSVATLVLLFSFGFAAYGDPLGPEISRAPFYFVVRDVLRDRTPVFLPAVKVKPPKLASTRTVIGPRSGPADHDAQARSVAFIHPLYTRNVTVSKPKLPKTKVPWNVVFVVMESTGTRYMFTRPLHWKERVKGKAVVGDPRGRPIPMPFVKSIVDRALFLDNHYSPSNSSARSIFSIFSGLYPMPEIKMFSTKRIWLPSLFSLLPEKYERFLVTPGPLGWFFPRFWLKHAGLKEAHGYGELPNNVPRYRGESKAPSRDELATVNFFLKRLSRAKEPFAAVYYSFVPHWPYPDYGEEYRLVPPLRGLNRYVNNLRFLDRQIERIFSELDNQGRLGRTIVVLVGDHGEAFGQHFRNRTHSRASYNENFQTPAIFFQPKLFKPRRVKRRTQHPDILPTLLDAMGLDYNPQLFQGESIFQDKLRRRYTILFGNENTLSTISHPGVKLQLSFKFRRCWVFDLANDPWETKKLSCRREQYTRQKQATIQYHAYQRQLLRLYSASHRMNQSFFGQSHE